MQTHLQSDPVPVAYPPLKHDYPFAPDSHVEGVKQLGPVQPLAHLHPQFPIVPTGTPKFIQG
jgi:hypothetical protein